MEDPDKIGSIYIPDTARKRVDQGIVKYIGSEVKEIQPGDLVLFSGYSGQQVNIKSAIDNVKQSLIVLEEDFIIAILVRQGDLTTTIPGLYLKDENGYFNCPLDVAIELIAKVTLQDKSIDAFESKKEFGRGI